MTSDRIKWEQHEGMLYLPNITPALVTHLTEISEFLTSTASIKQVKSLRTIMIPFNQDSLLQIV